MLAKKFNIHKWKIVGILFFMKTKKVNKGICSPLIKTEVTNSCYSLIYNNGIKYTERIYN